MERADSPATAAIGCLFVTVPLVGWAVVSCLIWGFEGFNIFLTIVSCIAFAICTSLVYQWIRDSKIGATTVEISHWPVIAGEPFEVLVQQPGRAVFERLAFELKQTEKVEYQQGTSTRKEEKVVRTIPLADLTGEEVPQSDFGVELRQEAQLPATVMPSFSATHNKIEWSLSIEIDITGWPALRRHFPVQVALAAEEPGTPLSSSTGDWEDDDEEEDEE